jgi:ribosome-associated toxin RatA of RatAB toxin-antitoxin module
MRSIRLKALIPGGEPGPAFARITDFARYPEHADDVHAVRVHRGLVGPEATGSDWEVAFRRGVMRWTELDEIDPDALTVSFAQTEGDFDAFHGTWRLAACPEGCEALFEVTYDFGIESLAGLMDPLAERVIKRVVCCVLAAIAGTVEVREGGAALTDLGELPADSGIRIASGGS